MLKDHLGGWINHSRIRLACFISLTICIFSSGCAKTISANSIGLQGDEFSAYPKVIEEILPAYIIERSDSSPYQTLKYGKISEAFGPQAVGALETGIAKFWYPQYLATVIIAADRDQTDQVIGKWSDLVSAETEVSFLSEPKNAQMFIAAMSYGLEGDRYSVQGAVQLLSSLQDKGLLRINSTKSPLMICYDYQAAHLIKNGRNLEIIIPADGTFNYEKGLLSNTELIFNDPVDAVLLDHLFRLPDGQANGLIYPDSLAYAPASRVTDHQYFATATNNVRSLMERTVLNSKWLMSVDDREHLHFALIFMIIITLSVASFLRRSMQKGVSLAALSTGIILNGWTLVRLIKYQVVGATVLSRYLWYAYYIFLLYLPIVLLWMAWAIDKPEKDMIPPKWWRLLTVLVSLLLLFVFTNDLHGYVFKLDLSRQDWAINYSYGFGYYLILFVSMSGLLATTILLLVKSLKNPRRKAFIFPVTIFIMFAVYNYKYIMRDPFVYQTDLTIITGIFTLLMFEVCIRSGLIPVNTKHNELFRRSPLKMQIINNSGLVVLASTAAMPIDPITKQQVLRSSPATIFQADDSVLFATPIPGGTAIWHEDVSKLVQLQRAIHDSTKQLTKANAILMEEEKIKRAINEANEKKQLMDQLEAEIADGIAQLTMTIEALPTSKHHTLETTRIALLLCYLKRRCNLFFQEKEETTMSVEEIAQYIEELIEIANYSNVRVASQNKLSGRIEIRQGTLVYDFFYAVVDWAVQTGCPYIIEHLVNDGAGLTMRLLPAGDIEAFEPSPKLLTAIERAHGKIIRKDLEETISISLYFKKGGLGDDQLF